MRGSHYVWAYRSIKNMSESVEMTLEERFNSKLKEMAKNKGQNSLCYTREKYNALLLKVKEAKMKKFGKKPGDYQRLKRYDITQINGEERIVCARSVQGPNLRYYVHTDEVFPLIHQAHLAIGHGGRDKMVKQVQKNFKNITAEEISIYLGLCEICSKRSKIPKRSPERLVTSRCQIDLINVHFQPDGLYNFILIYQDCATKFIQLRALRTNAPKEIADNLIDIFTILKPPHIIQSTTNWELNNQILEELISSWKNLEIIFGVPEAEEDTRRTNQDIENMLIDWLEENQTDEWSKGLRFIQLMLNEKYNPSIKCSAFDAMFNNPSKNAAGDFLQNHQDTLPVEEERHGDFQGYVKMEGNYESFHKNEMMDMYP